MAFQVTDVTAYEARRRNVERRFNALRHGCQAAASYDLRMSASIISSVLRGRFVSKSALRKLEAWLDESDKQNERAWQRSLPSTFVS